MKRFYTANLWMILFLLPGIAFARNAANKTENLLMTPPPVPLANFSASATTICAGSTITFTDQSSSSPTSWSWTLSGGTPATSTVKNPTGIVFSTAGTYTITLMVTNGSGSNSTTKVITVNANPVVTSSATLSTLCTGNSSILTSAGALTYLWSPAAGLNTTLGASVTATPSSTTTYTVTGKDANGCKATSSRLITVNPLPSIISSPASPSLCTGGHSVIVATGTTTYSWSPATGLSATSGSTVTASPASTTTYTLTGTNVSGCTSSRTFTVTVNAVPVVSSSATLSTVCAGSPTSLTASGASTYSWSPATGLNINTGATVIASPVTTTTYTATGMGVDGCTATSSKLISVNALPAVSCTPASAGICSGANVVLTASGAVTYSWNPATGLSATAGAAVTATPVATTTYTITGTSATGCINTKAVVVTVNALPVINTNPPAPSFCSGSNVAVAASGASTYSWSPALGLNVTTGISVLATPISTTTYTITGTTAAGCVNTHNVVVTVNANPVVTSSASFSAVCDGSSSTLTGSGAVSYHWSPPTGLSSTTTTVVTATPTASTTYTVTGTAANGCKATSAQHIVVNPIPVMATTPISPSYCTGGSVAMTETGATTYSWSPSTGLSATTGATVTASPAATSTYTVIGTSSTGCVKTRTVTVTVNANPVVTSSATLATVCAGASTTLTGSGAVTYAWSPSTTLSASTGASVTATPTTTTTYTVTGKAANGCKVASTELITVNALPVLVTSPLAASFCVGGHVAITASGASTYAWSPSTGLSATTGASVIAFPVTSTTYTLTGTSAAGCVKIKTVPVQVKALPVITSTPASPTLVMGTHVVITASGASYYSWSPSTGLNSTVGPSVTASPSVNSTYTVTGTNQGGCSSTEVINVTVTSPPIVPVISSNETLLMNPTVLGIQNSDAATNLFSIYPNPNNGIFDLNFTLAEDESYDLNIYNSIGQLKYSEKISHVDNTYTKTIDLKQNGSGIYMISLVNSKHQMIKKVIVY
jgi:PKD repeat protein